MPKVIDLFEVFYGTNLELNKLKEVDSVKSGVHYVSRTRKNNGVSAIVEICNNKEPLEAGLITVAVGSDSVMESFVQPSRFYTGRDVYCLKPRKSMTLEEKIFYCTCLRHNKFKYNYGRQANKTLEYIELPDQLPEWVYKSRNIDVSKLKNKIVNKNVTINVSEWKYKKCNELFDVNGGKSIQVNNAILNPGNTPLISATRYDNGVRCYTGYEPTHSGNVLSVVKNGSSVCEAFYQEYPFCRTTDVWVLSPKFDLDKYIALFFSTLIKKEKYRYNYGRKLNKDLMENMIFKVPVNQNNELDLEYIRNIIKKIKYSASI